MWLEYFFSSIYRSLQKMYSCFDYTLWLPKFQMSKYEVIGLNVGNLFVAMELDIR